MIASRADGTTFDMAAQISPAGGSDGANVLADANAVALAASTACSMVIIQNDPASAGYLKVGLTNTPKIQLAPGQFAPPLYVTNLNKIYVQAVSTATANYTYQV